MQPSVRSVPARSAWLTFRAALPNRSTVRAWATSVPSSVRGAGSSITSSSSAPSGSPASASSAPVARCAATGANRSRPWKVADTGSRRWGEREMSTTWSTPPQRLPGQREQPVVRTHQQPTVLAAQGDGAALGAHLRVHHPHVHSARQVGQGVAQHDRPLPHGEAPDAVGEVDDLGVGRDPADHAVADAHELVVVAVVGEEGDDHALASSRSASTRPSMSWRSASTCTVESVLAGGLAGDGPDRHHAGLARQPAGSGGLQEEPHRGAGGEGHVVGLRQPGLGRRSAARPRSRRAAATSTWAPRSRRASGSTSRASEARATSTRRPSIGTSARASTSDSAIDRGGTTSARMPRARQLGRGARTDRRHRGAGQRAGVPARAASAVEQQRRPVRAGQAHQRVLADVRDRLREGALHRQGLDPDRGRLDHVGAQRRSAARPGRWPVPAPA